MQDKTSLFTDFDEIRNYYIYFAKVLKIFSEFFNIVLSHVGKNKKMY